MPLRFSSLVLALSFALASVACGPSGRGSLAPAPASAPSSTTRPDPRPVYRFDYVVRLARKDGATTVGKYSFGLEEGRNGEVHLGANVPLSRQEGAPVARRDAGFLLRSSYVVSKGAVLLHCNVEMSSADELPSVRKLVTSGDLSVAPGTPAVLARVDDPDGHFRYEVEVTATKMDGVGAP